MVGMFWKLTIVLLVAVPFSISLPTTLDMNGKAYPLLDGLVVAKYDRFSPSVRKRLNEQEVPKQPEIAEDQEPSADVIEEAQPGPEEGADDKYIIAGLMVHAIKVLEDKLEIAKVMNEVSQDSVAQQLIIERLMKQ